MSSFNVAVIDEELSLYELLMQHEFAENLHFICTSPAEVDEKGEFDLLVNNYSSTGQYFDVRCKQLIIKDVQQELELKLGDISVDKPFSLKDICASIVKLCQGFGDIIHPENDRIILSCADKELKVCGEVVGLTDIETGIMKVLLTTSEPVSKERFLQEIWGYDVDSGGHSLQNHIYKLRKKLGKLGGMLSSDSSGYRFG